MYFKIHNNIRTITNLYYLEQTILIKSIKSRTVILFIDMSIYILNVAALEKENESALCNI